MIQNLNPAATLFVTNENALTNQITQLTNEASSGLKISQPSDDPGDLVTLMQIRSELDANEQVTNNLAPVLSNTQAAESALQTAVSLVSQATDIGTQGANTLTSSSEDAALVPQVADILQQLVGLANTQVNGQYIFSGDQPQSAAYTLNTTSPTGVSSLIANPQATQQIADSNGTTFPVALTAQQIFDHQTGSAGFAGNTVNLNNPAATFLGGGTQTYTFNYVDSTGATQTVSVAVNGGAAGINGTTVISQLNTGLAGTGITASISATDGTLQFTSAGAFTVGVAAATAGNPTVTAPGAAVNTAQFNLQSAAFSGAGGTLSGPDTFTLSDGHFSANVSLAGGTTVAAAVTDINAALQAAGITDVSALATGDGTAISLQGAANFTVVDTTAAAGGPSPLFTTAGNVAVTAPANGGAAAPDNVFNAVNSLLVGLQTNNQAAITNAVNSLQLAGNYLNQQEAFYGSVQDRVEAAQTLASQQNVQLQSQLSQTQDADVTEVAVELAQDQTDLQAGISAEAQITRLPTLFNYLG